MDVLKLIGRTQELFADDILNVDEKLNHIINTSSFLVLGGAGTIGQAVTKEIFKRNPKKLHVIDISENNLVELVRDIRSSFGYIKGEFLTFALDIGSLEYDVFIDNQAGYDYVLNLSALKHVRSEKDPYTLMRMIEVNILNTEKTIIQSIKHGAKKYFCVSTDKAANPVNMMGASKKIMELFLLNLSSKIEISTARFANVAFSDGSLLQGFNYRIEKKQPIVAPNDVKRYFVTPKESGELCLLSCIFGNNRDIFFPKLSKELNLIGFDEIAKKYIKEIGYEPLICENEETARSYFLTNENSKKWPCLFTSSDTTGEKDFEEFYTEIETLDFDSFKKIGIIKNVESSNHEKINLFKSEINRIKQTKSWDKTEIINLFNRMLPDFNHIEKGKYLDSKM